MQILRYATAYAAFLLPLFIALPTQGQVHYHDSGAPWTNKAQRGPDAKVGGWYYNLGITASYRSMMDNNRWWFTLAHCADGTFYFQPNRDYNASDFTSGDSRFSAESEEAAFTKDASREVRPNILLIVGEDHGCELSCYDDPVIKTPNIDRFASQGVLFENGYVTQSVCSPSRSTIFTGLYPHQNGQLGLATHHYGWFRQWLDGFQCPGCSRSKISPLQSAVQKESVNVPRVSSCPSSLTLGVSRARRPVW